MRGAEVRRRRICSMKLHVGRPAWSRAMVTLSALALPTLIVSARAEPPGEFRLLTSKPYEEREPAVSADGRLLAFLADPDGDRASELRCLDLQSGEERTLYSANPVESAPAWSPDGMRLLVSLRVEGRLRLHWVEAAGGASGAAPLDAVLSRDAITPAVSPDGRSISFAAAATDGNYEIILAGADGGRAELVAPSPARDLCPRFSADGRFLYFFSRRDTAEADDELYRANLASSAVERLTRSPTHDFAPAPSPDGERLALVSLREGAPAIFVMTLKTGAARRISPLGYSAGHRVWSPDARKIYFTLRRGDAPADIAVMDIGRP